METEREIFQYLRAGKLLLPPLSFKPLSNPKKNELEVGMLLETTWQNKRYKFVAEVKRYNSDKTILQAANQARYYAQKLKVNPLVIVPWLSNDQLIYLEKQGISGLDLCGNGVIMAPEKLLVFRSGQPNKFPASRLIRRVYEGTTSLVARVFLLKTEYSSLVQILHEIIGRGGSITLPTISKALKQLEEDVVIEKSRSQIRLLQPDKLLDRLKENYEPPKLKGFLRCKLTVEKNEDLWPILAEAAEQAKSRLVLSGESSVNYYATMAKEPISLFYCTEFPTLQLQQLGANVDIFSRFPNLELRETDIESVYFDKRKQKDYNVASPIQTYLELATSDKRGQDTAQQIRQQILDNLTKRKKEKLKMSDQALYDTFLDLHYKLSKKDLNIILGGGYGLFLKQLVLMSESGVRTLLPVESLARPRSTSDLDIFFPLKLLINLEEMQGVRTTIDEMRFKPIIGSEYWSFLLPESRIKIDLLTGPIEEAVKTKLKSDSRRARPKGDLQLHAHPVPEALGLSEHLEQIPLSGNLPGDKQYSAMANIPSPFSYLMMKITTFGDQLDNPDKDQGRHHALDVYRIVAMINEDLFAQTKQQFQKHSASKYVIRVKELSKECFGEPRATGILRMKEHALFGENMLINNFIEILHELMLI